MREAAAHHREDQEFHSRAQRSALNKDPLLRASECAASLPYQGEVRRARGEHGSLMAFAVAAKVERITESPLLAEAAI